MPFFEHPKTGVVIEVDEDRSVILRRQRVYKEVEKPKKARKKAEDGDGRRRAQKTSEGDS